MVGEGFCSPCSGIDRPERVFDDEWFPDVDWRFDRSRCIAIFVFKKLADRMVENWADVCFVEACLLRGRKGS